MSGLSDLLLKGIIDLLQQYFIDFSGVSFKQQVPVHNLVDLEICP